MSHSKLGASSNQLTAQAAITPATGFEGDGDGSQAKPFLIATAEQLAFLAQEVNAGNATYSAADKHFKLTANIELNVTTGWASWTDKTAGLNAWTPIGTIANPFNGVFDGNGKTVSGIYISGSADNQGLFGQTGSTATLQNVGVINSYIKGNENVGGVVGKNDSGKVINCHNTGKIDASGFNIGGVVGQNYYGSVINNSSVINCYNSGEVTGAGTKVGGVVGYNNLGGKVINCYNLGSVKGFQYIGGVVGFNNGDCTVKNCYNSGNVTGDYYLGGVTGNNASGGTVDCCYFLKNTTVNAGLSPNGSGRASSCATFDDKRKLTAVGGGLIISGKETLFEALNEGARVYNEGNKAEPNFIVAAPWATDSNGNPTHTEPEKKPGEVFTGGDGSVATPYLIATVDQLKYLAEQVNKGNTECNAKNYKLTANIELNTTTDWDTWNDSTKPSNVWTPIGDTTNPFKGTFNGDGHTIGGVYISGGDRRGLFGETSSTAIIINVGVIKSYIRGGDNVGGIVGFNGGAVVNCYYQGKVRGYSYVGGIVGNNTGSVINCYNSGAVSGVNANGETITGNSLGGVVGGNTREYVVNRCYFLTTETINKGVSLVGVLDTKEKECASFSTDGSFVETFGSYAIIAGKTTLIDALNFGFKAYNGASQAPKIKATPWIAVGGGYPTFTAAPTPITPADKFAGGDGTKENPYLIDTAEQLAYMAQEVNKGNNYSRNKHFKLTADIVLNDITSWNNWETTPPAHCWTPIGIQYRKFNGTFDGDGHTVSGIYIGGGTKIGLFGETDSEATIKNVGVINSFIGGTADKDNGNGGVVGYNDGKVINCYNSGTINGLTYIGGVVGFNTEYGKVINCYNTGALSGLFTPGFVYGDYNGCSVGGVAGGNVGLVINCYNLGSVKGNLSIGGVVGMGGNAAKGAITNCYNSGAVTGTSIIGGVVGEMFNDGAGVITNCFNIGEISVKDDPKNTEIVGGVVGMIGNHTTGAVANCYFLTGKIKIGANVQPKEQEKTIGSFLDESTESGTAVFKLTNCSAFDASKKLTTAGSITPDATNKALVKFEKDADLLATLNAGVKAYNGVSPAPEILAAKWYTDVDADGNPSFKSIVEIVTAPDNKVIYANGRAITLKAVSATYPNLTNIYYNEDLVNAIVLAGLTATNGGYDLSEYTVYGGGETAITGKTSVTMTDGKVKNVYGGGNGAAVNASASVTINGGTIAGNVYGGGNGANATVGGTKNITISGGTITGNVFGGDVGNKAVINISGAPAIGTAAGTSPVTPATGIIINGGSVANGVDSFVINGNLSGAANSINLVLPKGFVAKTVATKTSGITAEVAKFALVGDGSNKKTLAITATELKVETNLTAISIETHANAPVDYDGKNHSFEVVVTNPAGLTGFTVQYKKNGTSDAYSATAPINKGSYDVKISRDEDADNAAFEATITNGIVINTATNEWEIPFSIADINEGETPSPKGKAKFGELEIMYFKMVEGEEPEVFPEPPTKAGTYFAAAAVYGDEDGNYSGLYMNDPIQFKINKRASDDDSGSGSAIPPEDFFWTGVVSDLKLKTEPVVEVNCKYPRMSRRVLLALQEVDKTLNINLNGEKISITSKQVKSLTFDKASYSVAELKALLEVKPEVTPTPTPTPTQKPTEPVVPETPAANLTWLWILLAVIAVGAVVAFVVIKRKKK